MKKPSSNKSLHKAKDIKNDEFYTRFDDIQAELNFYKDQFKGKVIYCNCDDPAESAFIDFFKLNFDYLGIKKLIGTRYQKSNLFLFADPARRNGYRLEITAKNKDDKKPVKINLKGDGDFRSPECIELLEEADIVITNPPFSLFREYVAQLMKYNKKFLIIGNDNAIKYKGIFELIKENKVWLGYTRAKEFYRPDGSTQKFGNVGWYTNLDVKKRHEELFLYKTYKDNKKDYPKYDNYDAIEVSRIKNIPMDYEGSMGVPITFLNKHNPGQFDIIDLLNRYTLLDTQKTNEDVRARHSHTCNINGKAVYSRIVIKRKK
ncbi:MAG: modification methylase [Candidatus Colwellbacteria bacterium]|nr:modification methylase [Candidatus Colwellbacteria bacterium]